MLCSERLACSLFFSFLLETSATAGGGEVSFAPFACTFGISDHFPFKYIIENSLAGLSFF